MKFLRKLLVAVVTFVVVVAGFYLYATHGHKTDRPLSVTEGPNVTLVAPEPEKVPTVGISSIVGWGDKGAPQAAAGLVVNRFATGLDHPRTMLTLPNGDVIVAESDHPADKPSAGGGGIMDRIRGFFYRQAGAGFQSPNTLVLLRDANGDGVAEERFVLRKDGLDSPSGLAWGGDKLYVANHDAVLAFDYKLGETAISGAPKKLASLPASGNHWMRNLLLSPDGKTLYVAVGSSSNIGENGMDAEKYRAAIFQMDVSNGHMRQFAGGLRNPNGLDWNPATGELWTTVNERDMLGGDLVPDYLTNVPIGAQYGWPWYYWKNKLDERVDAPMPIYLNEYIRKPEYALGAHTAALGLRFTPAGSRMGAQFQSGAFIARHGSWNRNPPSGYDVIFVNFDANGNPKGMPVPVLTGFRKDAGHVYGRPVWISFDKTGAMLVTDDGAGIVWRVIDPKAAPSAGVKPVVTGHIPMRTEINGANEAEFRRQFEEMMTKGQ